MTVPPVAAVIITVAMLAFVIVFAAANWRGRSQP